MPTTIYMMRHGGVENPDGLLYERLPGFPLSQEGRRQVNALAEKMKRADLGLCRIISSPLERAQQTAQIIADVCHAPLSLDGRLTEWGVGKWAGKPVQDFYEHSGYYARPMVTDGLEPHEMAAARVSAVVDELRSECTDKTSLIVSHRESMASAILKLTDKPYATIHDLDMPIASVWSLVFDGMGFVSAGRVW